MAEFSRALDQGSTLEFEGKTYRLAPLTFLSFAAFEQWMIRRAWRAAEQSAKWLPVHLAEARLDAVTRDVAAGVFSWGSRLCGEASQTAPGQKYLLFLMLAGDPANEATEELADRIMEEKYREAAAKIAEAHHDPFSSPAGSPSPSTTSAPG
jgi:hypothetical protein